MKARIKAWFENPTHDNTAALFESAAAGLRSDFEVIDALLGSGPNMDWFALREAVANSDLVQSPEKTKGH